MGIGPTVSSLARKRFTGKLRPRSAEGGTRRAKHYTLPGAIDPDLEHESSSAEGGTRTHTRDFTLKGF